MLMPSGTFLEFGEVVPQPSQYGLHLEGKLSI